MQTLSFYNRSNPLKSVTKFLLIAGVSCLMGSSLFAQTFTWTGNADTNFWNAANWTPAGYNNPGGAFLLFSKDSSVVTAPINGTVYSRIVVSGTGLAANAPTLNINANVSTVSGGRVTIGESIDFPGSIAGYGIINQTSGTMTNNSGSVTGVIVAAYKSSGQPMSSGTYNFGSTSAGTAPAIVPTGAGVDGIMIGGGGNGVMNLTGYGTLNLQSGWYSLCVGQDRIWNGASGGSGALNITGGNLSIHTTNFYLGGANSTLSETLDGSGATGVSTIFCSGTARGINGGVWISNGTHFSLTLGTGFSATVGQAFTIIDSASAFDGGTASGASLANPIFSGLSEGGTISANGYTFSVTYTGASSYSGGDAFILTTTAVPEPQTWVMMFSGFAMLMGGRRMRRK